MKVMRKIFLLLINLNFIWYLGQQSSDLKDFTPTTFPSTPNAVQLEKYVDQKVQLSSGLPDISIPIYTIQQGNISIPISLSYYAGGIKVEQEATNVGLGWTLNAGGMISRTMNSIPDDFKYGDYGGYMYTIYTQDALYVLEPPADEFILQSDNDLPTTIELYRKTKQFDDEADLFHYTLPNGGGKLAYNQSEAMFIQMPLSLNKVEPQTNNVNGMIEQWIITEPNGNKYYFGYNEQREIYNQMAIKTRGMYYPISDMPSYYTTWYLSKIEDILGNEVIFEYGKNLNVYKFSRNSRTGNGGQDGASMDETYTTTRFDEIYLYKIRFKGGYVKFENSAELRLDLNNSKRLSSIKVFSDKSTPSEDDDVLIRNFSLGNNNYFNGIQTNGQYYGDTASDNDVQKKRLKLDYIEEIIPNSTNKKYSFEYNEIPLPQKFSYAQDYWGGYNGKNENVTLYPEIVYINPYSKNLETFIGNGNKADRAVDSAFTEASTLTKIIYPTKGYTQYKYEPNTASNLKYIENYAYAINYDMNLQKKLPIRNIKNPYTENIYEFEKSDPQNKCTFTMTGDTSTATWNCNFQVNHILQASIINNFEVDCHNDPYYDPNTPPVLGGERCGYIAKLFDSNNNEINNANNSWFGLVPGNYKLQVRYAGRHIADGDNYLNDSGWFAEVKVREDVTPDIRTIGGLRVKDIETFDNNGNLEFHKKYEYNLTDSISNLLSSGTVLLPQFGFYTVIKLSQGINTHIIYPASDSDFLNFISQSVSYSKVKETTINVKTNEEIIKDYTFIPKSIEAAGSVYNSVGDNRRSLIYADAKWRADKPLQTIDFKNGLPLLTVGNDYQSEEINTYYTFTAGRHFIPYRAKDGNTSLPFNPFSIFYPHFSDVYPLVTVTTTENLSTGNFTTTQNYTYSPNNPLLISSQITQSSGETRKTEFLYPQDLVGAESYMTNLVQENRISDPVITKAFKENVQLSEQKIIYSKDAETSQKVLPKFVYFKNGAGAAPADTRITYNRYDDKGNLIQYTLNESNTPTTIIWGYNQTQPIAKIEGATYAQVSSLATSIITASNTDATATPGNDESALLGALKTFRTNLSDYQVTTYTYDPLIGVRSITPPSGITEFYKYDTAGRLKEIRDINDNVLKEFKYNYKH